MTGSDASRAHYDREPTHGVLLGWLGSEIKNLQHYANMYSRLSVPSVTYISPWWHWMAQGRAIRSIARLLDAAAEQREEMVRSIAHPADSADPRLVMHAFSNNGALALVHALPLLQSSYPDLARRLRIVIDSAPAPIDGSMVARSVSAAIHARFVKGRPAQYDTVLTAPLHMGVRAIAPLIRNKDIPQLLQSRWGGWPALCLYSTADTCIGADAVQDFIDRMDGLAPITQFDFGTTSHCGHLKDQPTLYSQVVQHFLHHT